MIYVTCQSYQDKMFYCNFKYDALRLTQYAIRNMQVATRNTQYAIRNMQVATRNTEYTQYGIRVIVRALENRESEEHRDA